MGKKGILDATHTRLFTFRSLRALLEQAGYELLEATRNSCPYPLALGHNCWSRILLCTKSDYDQTEQGTLFLSDLRACACASTPRIISPTGNHLRRFLRDTVLSRVA